MIDVLKKMDKKFLITSGLLIFIPLLIIIILMIVRGCSTGSSYESYEEKMISSAQRYFEYHDVLPNKEGKEVVVNLDDLVEEGLKSPEKAVNDATCTGSVTAKKNGKQYFYIPYLECKDYTTDYIINHLKKDIVSKESGLYKVGNEYIYKGNKVKNYISFFDTLYRIVKIDSNGNLRLIKNTREDDQISWDDRFNVSADDSVGINDYYNSLIYDAVWNAYRDKKLFTPEMKKHIVAHSVCLDKKAVSDTSVEEKTCTNTLNNQFISIPSLYDYSQASYDKDCVKIGDGACANYNYLDEVITSSWTINASSDDTRSVYYITGSYVDVQDAINYKNYHWIISISGNELYTQGKGTLEDPYVIK